MTIDTTHHDSPRAGVLNVQEFCAWARISRAQFYLEVASGRLVPRKVGRRTLIPVTEAYRWLSGLPTAG